MRVIRYDSRMTQGVPAHRDAIIDSHGYRSRDLISQSRHARDHPSRSRSIDYKRFHHDADQICKGYVVRVEEVTIRYNGSAVTAN